MKKTFCWFVILIALSILISELSLLSPQSQVCILITYFIAGLGVACMGYLEGVYPGHKAFLLIFGWPAIIVHEWQEWFMKDARPIIEVWGSTDLAGKGKTIELK